MTGFSPDWLALREPADHAARADEVARAVSAHFESEPSVTVVIDQQNAADLLVRQLLQQLVKMLLLGDPAHQLLRGLRFRGRL